MALGFALAALTVSLSAGSLSSSASAQQAPAQQAPAQQRTTEEPVVQAQGGRPISGTGCSIYANNPHITLDRYTRRIVKGFGGVQCSGRKDRLWAKVVLQRKWLSSNTWRGVKTVRRNDDGSGWRADPWRNMLGATRLCRNSDYRRYRTRVWVTVVQYNGDVRRTCHTSLEVRVHCSF